MGNPKRAEEVWRMRYEKLPETADTSYYELALALLATENGNLAEGRRVLEKYRGSPFRGQTHLTEIAALLGETDYAVETIAGHPQRNYRWLVSTPSLRRLAKEPAFAELTRALHKRWLSDLDALKASLPAPPLSLPDPDSHFLASRH